MYASHKPKTAEKATTQRLVTLSFFAFNIWKIIDCCYVCLDRQFLLYSIFFLVLIMLCAVANIVALHFVH